MIIKSICVFCGSSFGKNDIYRDKTVELGKFIAEKGINLIYGGGAAGLMGVLAESVLDAGGKVIGVIPELIYPKIEGFIKEIHKSRLISESDHKVLYSKLIDYDEKTIDKWS